MEKTVANVKVQYFSEYNALVITMFTFNSRSSP